MAVVEVVQATPAGVPAIEVDGVLRGMPMITLAPGVRLHGAPDSSIPMQCHVIAA